MAYPAALDSLANPGESSFTDDTGLFLDVVISTLNDIAEALEAKVGISESSAQDTPLASTVFASLTNGKSKWTGSPTLSGIVTAAGLAISGNVAILPAPVSGTPAQNGLFANNFPKGWARIDVSAGTPSNVGSFNVSGITDNGVGNLTVTWDRDFSSVNYAAFVSVIGNAAVVICQIAGSGIAVGSTQFLAFTTAGAAVDPSTWCVSAIGVQ